MKLSTKQKNLLANRAFLLAEINTKIATSRSMDDEARVDGMLSWHDEFDKTTLYDAYEAYRNKYLSSKEQFDISISFLAKLYNYAYEIAYTCEQDASLVYHFKVTYSEISKAIFEGIENPDLVSESSNEIIDQRKESQRLTSMSTSPIARSLSSFSDIFFSKKTDSTHEIEEEHQHQFNTK